MALNTYGHVFDEVEDTEPASAEQLTRDARATLVRPSRQSVGFHVNKNSASQRSFPESRRPDSNRGPLHYE